MGFSYAGSLGGAGAPVVRRFQAGTDLYNGVFVVSNMLSGTGGHVELAVVAAESFEDDSPLIGFVSAVADNGRTTDKATSGTAGKGDLSTYTVTVATIAANLGTGLTGGAEVDVTLALPMDTLIRAPIYDETWGTALPELTVTTGDANAVTITHADDATACTTDDFNTAYCRSGANKGHYRVVTTAGANANTVTVPFPYAIAEGDVFVIAGCVLGYGGLQFTTAIDGINGDYALTTAHYSVYYHEINLEESGKEYAVFALWPQSVESAT
jgi:hypothetical protein